MNDNFECELGSNSYCLVTPTGAAAVNIINILMGILYIRHSRSISDRIARVSRYQFRHH